VKIDILEIKSPELDAQLIAENVAVQLERRISFRRAMKRAVQTSMEFGALGIRIRVAGRLGGADIARAEWYREGKVPLQTLRTPLDYGFTEAHTVYGRIGVKVWVNRVINADGEVQASQGGERRARPPRKDGDRRGPGGPGGNRGRGPGGPGGPGGNRGRGPRRDDAPAAPAGDAPAPPAA
jgi:small subunit ribosomal protein S3